MCSNGRMQPLIYIFSVSTKITSVLVLICLLIHHKHYVYISFRQNIVVFTFSKFLIDLMLFSENKLLVQVINCKKIQSVS
jgi:hypothetical protein